MKYIFIPLVFIFLATIVLCTLAIIDDHLIAHNRIVPTFLLFALLTSPLIFIKR